MYEKNFYQIVTEVIQRLNSKDIYLYGLDFELYAMLELESVSYEGDIEEILLELIKVAYNRSSSFFRYGKLNTSEIENILRKMEKADIYDENERFVRLIESVQCILLTEKRYQIFISEE